jgi:hypothetical protein
MKKPFIKVSRNVGMNPIARAVAKQQLAKTITTYRINIFMNEEGQQAGSDYTTLRSICAATLGAMQEVDSLDYKKLRSAVSVTVQAEARGWTWSKADTVTLDNALAIVQSVFPKLPPEVANRSIQQAMKGFT